MNTADLLVEISDTPTAILQAVTKNGGAAGALASHELTMRGYQYPVGRRYAIVCADGTLVIDGRGVWKATSTATVSHEKHGQHNQRSHGNWAREYTAAEVESVLQRVRDGGGGLSVSMVDGSTPPNGYMVAKTPREGAVPSIVSEDEFFNPASGRVVLTDFLRSNREMLRGGDYLGVWHDGETGMVFLDVSENVKDRRRAIRLGRERNQISIWDVVRQEEINTGGTGEITKSRPRRAVTRRVEHDRRGDRPVGRTVVRPVDEQDEGVGKHGEHDQRSHGNWAVGRGGARDGRSRSGRTIRSGTGRVVRLLGNPADDPSLIDEAIERIQKGEIVEFDDAEDVHTFVKDLARRAQEAKDKGEQAPAIDLCRVSVPGTNLFCADSLGVKRIDMPQLSGKTVEGSRARAEAERQDPSKGPVADREVDIGPAFTRSLEDRGVAVRERSVPASRLRASQSQLVGANVAWMMGRPRDSETLQGRIFVTRDGYVIDGHHRWAALVGLDLADGRLGDVDINVREIDMPISEALQYANEFATAYGIAPKKG